MQQPLREGLHYMRSITLGLFKYFFNKVKTWGITTEDTSIADVLEAVECNLFNKVQFSNHCLENLLPDVRNTSHCMVLRSRGHRFEMPNYRFKCTRNSFMQSSFLFYFIIIVDINV